MSEFISEADSFSSIDQDAYKYGFKSAPQFTTAFKEAFGITPSKWRETFSSSQDPQLLYSVTGFPISTLQTHPYSRSYSFSTLQVGMIITNTKPF